MALTKRELEQLATDNNIDISSAKNNKEREDLLVAAGVDTSVQQQQQQQQSQSSSSNDDKKARLKSVFKASKDRQLAKEQRILDDSNYEDTIENVTIVISKIGGSRDVDTSRGAMDMVRIQAIEKWSGEDSVVTLNTNDEWLSTTFKSASVGQTISGITLGILDHDIWEGQCEKFMNNTNERNNAANNGKVMTMEQAKEIISQVQIIDSQVFKSVEELNTHFDTQRIRKSPLAATMGMSAANPTNLGSIMRQYATQKN